MQIITSIVNKKDVVAVLPTGFGKTFCFTAPVLILDKVRTLTIKLSIGPIHSCDVRLDCVS